MGSDKEVLKLLLLADKQGVKGSQGAAAIQLNRFATAPFFKSSLQSFNRSRA